MNYYKTQFNNTKILFVVYTDDIEWSKNNLKSSDIIVYSKLKKEEVNLAIMSLCDHVIMSTGSFSWWAGWFARGSSSILC